MKHVCLAPKSMWAVTGDVISRQGRKISQLTIPVLGRDKPAVEKEAVKKIREGERFNDLEKKKWEPFDFRVINAVRLPNIRPNKKDGKDKKRWL
ncbi:MAG: hypothetical protein JWN37_353 [Candidatus Nomurabacteria bacterium]|nr:hypothetical protein [Candidatus Nomurabacteria bacterium]